MEDQRESNNLTWYKIYRRIASDLGIMFPLKQSEISPRINPIPNTLDFHLKKLSKKEISKNLDNISKVYYKLYKAIETFEDFKPDIFNEHCSEYPDRKINMSTVISVLYVSGFSGEELYNKAYAYMNKTGK